ncbi:TonB-dependent receptor [Sphingomonas kyungheensis]|uniref:TonB-dependent receptor n=1 Tax=Sphingomonas kyungheensis TaxID=1069987 RepID=A0ABU8GX94_9SPHN
MTKTFKTLLLLGAAGLAAPALAQTATPATDAAATDTTATPDAAADLGDIVVTAERRSENLQRVPLSVAVVGGSDLRAFQAGGEDILALSGRVPGLYIETTTGRIFPRFYIRGLGNIDFYLGASQPVSIIQDDVVLEHVALKSNPVFDVNQVEVLRGPQGSLFGRNTTAGIIKFDTIRPSQTWQGRVAASAGSLGTFTYDAGVGGPLVQDKVAIRLSGLLQHRNDWVDNSFAGTSQDGTRTPQKNAMGGFDERDVRLQVLLTPSDAFSVNVSGHARGYHGTSTIFHRAALRKGSNSVSAEPRDRIALDEGNNNPQDYDTYGTSVNAAYDFGPVTLTSISAYETTSGYSRGDTDGGAGANFPVNGVANGFGQSQGNIRALGQYTQEVRLASQAGQRFTWQVGGFYFRQNDTTDFYQRSYFLTTAARNPNNWVRLRDINTSWAAFGQASFKVTDAFTITGGARYTQDIKRTTLVKPVFNVAGTVNQFRLINPTAPTSVRLEGKEPSWDVSALYTIDPSSSVYARVARGFRGPTIQGRSAVFNSPFTTASSETITSYEVGAKGIFLDGRLRLNSSLFTYTVHDIQLNGNDVNGNGVLFNADKARAWGVEIDSEFRPVRNLTLTLGASALKSKIEDKRVYAQVCILNGVVVCTVQDPTIKVGANTFAQIDGNPLPNAPRWNLDATARYDLPLSNDGKLFVATDWNIQGYTNFVLYKTKEFYADGNFEGGVKVGYTSPDNNYEIAAFARNITNEKNLKGVIENYMAAVFNEPRVIGVSLSGRFR